VSTQKADPQGMSKGKGEGSDLNDRKDGSKVSPVLTCLPSFGMTDDGGRVNEIRRYRFRQRRMGKTGQNVSQGLPDVVAGLSEFGYDLFGMVMAARFKVQLDATDLDGVFKVQAVMEDVENVGFLLGKDAHELP